MVSIEPADPASADARWCLNHYFAELADRFEEPFDPARTLPADAGDLVPPAGVFLIARIKGQPAGCGALKNGELMRMWVDRPHRGLGIAARILYALEEQAVALGHERVRLYTNRSLGEAKAMYRARGYVEIPRYNDDPYANHWFGSAWPRDDRPRPLAREILGSNLYMTLATADEYGRPWVSPVYYASVDYTTFHWVSHPRPPTRATCP